MIITDVKHHKPEHDLCTKFDSILFKSLIYNILSFLKGKKSYLAGTVMAVQGIITIIEQFSELKGITQLLTWVKKFLSNEGTMLLMQGLAIMGIRAGISKQTAENK